MGHQIVFPIFIGQLGLRILHVEEGLIFRGRRFRLLGVTHVQAGLWVGRYYVDSGFELFDLDEVSSEISCKVSL